MVVEDKKPLNKAYLAIYCLNHLFASNTQLHQKLLTLQSQPAAIAALTRLYLSAGLLSDSVQQALQGDKSVKSLGKLFQKAQKFC